MRGKWIKISVLYFLLVISFGIFMHATFQLQRDATHAHINVVSWLTTAVIGEIYLVYPKAGNSPLGVAQFWLYNISLPVLLIGMFIIQPVVGAPLPLIHFCVYVGGIALALSIALFIVNFYKNVNEQRV